MEEEKDGLLVILLDDPGTHASTAGKGGAPRNYQRKDEEEKVKNYADAEVAVFRISFLIKFVFISVGGEGTGLGKKEMKLHIIIYL